MEIDDLLNKYSQGAVQLQTTIEQFKAHEWDQQPVPGRWSIRQLVCHIADFEIVYADRMKRVLAEDNPTLFSGDPDQFALNLGYRSRCVQNELCLIRCVRQQLLSILEQSPVESFMRTGVHSTSGPLTLETLLENVTAHIPHHLKFVEEKLAALSAA